jgi:uncharacterized membrane-anchored protein YhcB (DUF1043 family)
MTVLWLNLVAQVVVFLMLLAGLAVGLVVLAYVIRSCVSEIKQILKLEKELKDL